MENIIVYFYLLIFFYFPMSVECVKISELSEMILLIIYIRKEEGVNKPWLFPRQYSNGAG